MKSRKYSVYLTGETATVLRAVAPVTAEGDSDGDKDFSLSGRINTIVARYAEVLAENTPNLSLAEWCAICDAMNGCYIDGDDSFAGIKLLWAEVHDTFGLGEKWGIDQGNLVARLQAMSFTEKLAVAEVVQRFWANPGEADNEKQLLASGAKLKS